MNNKQLTNAQRRVLVELQTAQQNVAASLQTFIEYLRLEHGAPADKWLLTLDRGFVAVDAPAPIPANGREEAYEPVRD